MNAEIISVGTELLMGQITNTNARFLSQELSSLGINVYYHSVIGDNKIRLSQMLELALKRSDIIITTGGLGPTQDDLTKETIAKTLNLDMELDTKSLMKIENYFKKINKKMSDSNRKQAYFPKTSIVIENNNGTAPGCIVKSNKKYIIVLPGPPRELIPMFNDQINSFLLSMQNQIIKSSYIKIFGIGESELENKLIDLINKQSNPTIATYCSKGDVLLRVTAGGKDLNIINQLLKEYEKNIYSIIGEKIYSYTNESLEEVVGKILICKNKTISIAESCTAGMLSSLIGNIPNISKVFYNSVITYSNESKNKILNVKESTLGKYGAVSKETSLEMAKGVRELSNTDIGISITGIAGPGGGTTEKPVGLVFIGISTDKLLESYMFKLSGNRERIRTMASMNALNIIRKKLK
ncbi:MAG: competence/damage-inducible protein A [Clostridiales bacterium]